MPAVVDHKIDMDSEPAVEGRKVGHRAAAHKVEAAHKAVARTVAAHKVVAAADRRVEPEQKGTCRMAVWARTAAVGSRVGEDKAAAASHMVAGRMTEELAAAAYMAVPEQTADKSSAAFFADKRAMGGFLPNRDKLMPALSAAMFYTGGRA